MENLNQEERTIIAEFVFSNQTDVLIKSDVIKLIELFFKQDVIDAKTKDQLIKEVNSNSIGIVDKVNQLLDSKIDKKQGKAIMNEYYGGN